MASVRLELTDTWQDLGVVGIVGSCGADIGIVEILNADALPTGDQTAALGYSSDTVWAIPAPTSGNLYVCVSRGAGFIKYYEA